MSREFATSDYTACVKRAWIWVKGSAAGLWSSRVEATRRADWWVGDADPNKPFSKETVQLRLRQSDRDAYSQEND